MPMKFPPHPGRLIKSDLDHLQLSIAQAAEALGVSRSQLNRVVKGDSVITADMAVRLEAVIGSNADMWLRLQTAYDLAQIKNNESHPAHGMKRISVPKNHKSEQASLV